MGTGIEFAAPGPGAWALDRSHYPGGTTPISEWLITESMPAGMAKVFAELGAPVAGVAARFVNGFMYTRVLPLVGADRPVRRPPPSIVLRTVTRLHPEFRRRTRAATVTLRDRPSLAVAAEWERSIRPNLVERNRALQAVDPGTLADAELDAHVGELLDRLRAQYELHFWLHGHDLGPIARFLHVCIGWGIEPAEATAVLAGASPSTSRPLETLARLRELVEPASHEVSSLDDVRAVSPEAADLLDRHLDEYGWVLATGYDLTALTLGELPRLVLDSIRAAPAPGARRPEPAVLADELRERVPPSERSVFDEALRDARTVMDMRDDNGPLTVEWPMGLLRRALLAAGLRLEERGAVERASDALELTPEEARRVLSGGAPSADALAERRDRRIELAELDPPVLLGEPEPEPPLDVLPDPLAELVGMIRVAFAQLGMDGAAGPPEPDRDRWRGVGVGAGAVVATARVAASADDAIERLEPGEILVVRATSPAFNAVLAVAGGVVTADGGAMSHAAVLARELGIPAVVGARGALEIPDGAIVEVDASAGTVRIA